MRPTLENRLLLEEEENSRDYFDGKFQRLALAFGTEEKDIDDALALSVPRIRRKCHREAMDRFESECRFFSEYGMKYGRFLVTVCESGIP